MTEQALAEQTDDVVERDESADRAVADALEAIAADARRDPEAYLTQTVVEHGGE